MDDPDPCPQPQLTVTTELSRRGLMALRERLDELLRAGTTQGVADGNGRSDEEVAEGTVRDLWRRLGETSRRYLCAAAEASMDDEFVLDDIAARMSVDVQQVKAYHRNVARSAAQVSPDRGIFDSRREGTRTRLRMPPQVRTAVIAISKEER
jgi:hypothetical protein